MISKNLILMGMPGSGKGTLAKELIKISKLKHISTGNILRNEIQNKNRARKASRRNHGARKIRLRWHS